MFSSLISKGFISNIINNKDYEIASRDTRYFSWSFYIGGERYESKKIYDSRNNSFINITSG